MPSTLLLLILLTFSAPALAIYKCESGGKTTYSDTPCHNASGNMKEIAVTAPSSDTKAAQQKLAQDKKELQRLEARRHKEEAATERERQIRFKAHEAKKKKCENLALRSKWAKEDAAHAPIKKEARAKRKALRAAEKQHLECGH